MTDISLNFDRDQALAHLLRFLGVDGVTGQERRIGAEVIDALTEAGLPASAFYFDDAARHIPFFTQTGNLIVRMPGTNPRLPRLLFLAHLDTVPPCAGARPVRRGKIIRSADRRALGADNRTGVACLVTLAATLLQRRLAHPPLTLLFTVGEESGLWGSRNVELAALGGPVIGFNCDGSCPSEITIGGVGAERWEAEVYGQAAHAGVHPERGVSATVVVALALAEVFQNGWFGIIARDGLEGTSNVGSVMGAGGGSVGEATNVVTDYARVRGESRSHRNSFARAITRAYRHAFQKAARQVTGERGRKAKVIFHARRAYYPFHLSPKAPVVRWAVGAMERLGLRPTLRISRGGLDANWLVRRGIPTITFGAGQRRAHSVEAFVEIGDFLDGCLVALALATIP